MCTEAICPLAHAPHGITGPSPPQVEKTEAGAFEKWLDQEVTALNGQISTAEQSLTQLATGETGNLHQVMLDLEQARTSFQLVLQVRNKLLEGYQEMMRMQI